jgi:serine/threonine protein kinase
MGRRIGLAEVISTGGPFITEGERKAAELLQQLPEKWLVICNKVLPTSNGHSYEIDFIVVGKRWIFLIDEKSWHGQIRGNEEQWIHPNGSAERSSLAKIDYIAKIMAGHLKWKLPVLKQQSHFVRGGILLSITEQKPQIHDPRAASGLFLPNTICQRLQEMDLQDGNPLVGEYRQHIKTTLTGLAVRPSLPGTIGDYAIQDVNNIRPHVRLATAWKDGNPAEPRHLMIYDLGNNPLTLQKQKEFCRHEGQTLQKLHQTGLVPEIKDPFPWSDTLYILPIVPPIGRSLSAYPFPETREEFVQELQLAATCFKALDQIHANHVIHRALSPDAIYIQPKAASANFKIVFSNFYAARIEENTIASTLDILSIDDPYAHENLFISYEFADQTTDTFSLALILLERLSGTTISHIRTSIDSPILLPERPRWRSFLSTEASRNLTALFEAILQPAKGTTPPTANDIATRLKELINHLPTGAGEDEPQYFMDGRFQVRHLLGEGAMARTYLAGYTDHPELGEFALKQFFHPSQVSKQAIAEYTALKKINSKYLPHIDEIYLKETDDVHIKMEYIPGPTLQQVEAELPWTLERWWQFAQNLLNAVETLEQESLLHRDIKPANIILRETGNYPVLIDFGFAIQRGIDSRVVGTPLYLPPEAATTSQPPLSCDRYATGVVLFKTLTGQPPFLNTTNGQRRLIDLTSILDGPTRRLAAVLLRIVSPNPEERPASIAQIRNELQTALVTGEEPPTEQALDEQINPWVQAIRGLYRNSDTGNADNRGLDSEFVRQTYIPTALDKNLLPALFERLPRVVFLSGNPGDGKTAFLEQVQQELEKRGATRRFRNYSGWEWEYQGHLFRSCYDASESHAGLTADEQLTQKLQGLEGTTTPECKLTVLVAINDGRLIDYFARNQALFPWIAQQIEQARQADEMEQLAVWVIDLKRRAFVNMPDAHELSIFRHVLNSLIAEKHWTACQNCAAQTICPIRRNAITLQDKRIQKRLELLFLLVHMQRQQHITMRDLRSALAYIIGGNKNCEQIHAARHGDEEGSLLTNLAYWQSVFLPTDDKDDILQKIARLDPARFPQPQLDRFLHFHATQRDAELRAQLFHNGIDLPQQHFADQTLWIEALKRRLFFEARKPVKGQSNRVPRLRWTALLPYQHVVTFMKLLDGRLNAEERDEVRAKIALGMLRSDGITGAIPPGQLSVVIRHSEEQRLTVLKQLPLHEFELIVKRPQAGQMIETLPEIMIFQHRSGTPRIEITLDLFELLMRMAEGLQPNAPEFRPLLEDLKLFKDTLLLHETQDLVLIENQRTIHYITQREGKIVHSIEPIGR